MGAPSPTLEEAVQQSPERNAMRIVFIFVGGIMTLILLSGVVLTWRTHREYPATKRLRLTMALNLATVASSGLALLLLVYSIFSEAPNVPASIWTQP